MEGLIGLNCATWGAGPVHACIFQNLRMTERGAGGSVRLEQQFDLRAK